MEHTLQRWLERGIAARRADTWWLRSAMTSGRSDLEGSVSTVAGAVLTDRRQAWPLNLYGRNAVDGLDTAGDQLVMVTGDAAGDSWEIESVAGRTLAVVDDSPPLDLAAEGVAVGDEYRIERAFDARAIAFLGQSDVRVTFGYPADEHLVPCYSILPASYAEDGRPIGDTAGHVGGVAGPIQRLIHSSWRESYTVACVAVTGEGAVALWRFLRAHYLQSISWLGRAFESNVRASGDGLQQMATPWGKPVHQMTFTISGVADQHALEDTEWLVPGEVSVTPTPVKVAP